MGVNQRIVSYLTFKRHSFYKPTFYHQSAPNGFSVSFLNPFLMRKTLRSLLPVALLALGTAPKVQAQTFIAGITAADQLLIVNAATPSTPLFPPVPITGIAPGQTIAGADFRPRTGELFILGYNASNGESRLYTVSQSTGAATAIGNAAITLPLGTGSIGFDFNPTVDLIRVVAANRSNYRLNPVTGAIAAMDGTLTYAATDPNATATPSIGAGAYTNSYVASEVTTLYDFDESLNVLVSQAPPNAGTLNTIGTGIGIAINAGAATDMDIVYDSATAQNTAYLSVAATSASPTSNLYTVSLTGGTATLVGPIGNGLNVKDIAVVVRRNVPATVTGQLVYGLTRNNRNLISFDSDRPGIIRKFMPVTGVVPGQRLVGMDVRPADRSLYALGYNDSSSYTLYRIDTANGAATAINATPGTMALGGASARIGFDFNPTVDRIRISSSTTANFRLNPNDGAVAATDGNFKFIAGDANNGRPARIGAVAYTRSFQGTTSTMLYALDDSLGALLVVDTPNSGASRTLAANAFAPNPADATTDLDFFYDSTSTNDRGFLTLNTGSSSNDSLWTFVPSPAPPISLVGRIGLGVQVMDIAVQLRYTGPVSIRDLSLLPGVDIYPNPAGETLYVRTSGNGTVRAVIMDLSGRPVMSQTDVLGKVMPLQVGALPAGMYSIVLESNGVILGSAKVVKQ